MAKYVVSQSVTIHYQKIIEADGRIHALDLASEMTDLDDWREVDVESSDSIYVRELEEDDE